MSDETSVTHPPVSHPDTERPTDPTSQPDTRPPAKRSKPLAPRLRMPSKQVIAASLLLLAAAELLIWQVGGLTWGLAIHGFLAVLIAVVAVGVLRWVRRGKKSNAKAGGVGIGEAAFGLLGRRPIRSGEQAASKGTGRTVRTGQAASGPIGRLRSLLPGGTRKGGGGAGGSSATTSPSRRSALSRLLPGKGGRPATGTGATSIGQRTGRLRNLLSGTSGGRTGRAPSGAAGGAARGIGALRGLGARGGTAGKAGGSRTAAAGPGGGKGKPVAGKPRAWAQFLEGLRDGVAETKKPVEAKDEKPAQKKPEPEKKAEERKPQPPNTEQLVKEAVKQAAATTPAAATPTRSGGSTAVGDMNKVRAAADELAAALKDYDPEDMHQMVREMPGLADALTAVSGGLRHVASRAESEWPVAGPVVEGIRSMADDIKAAAGTAEEARGTLRRENETDIERGEAPRHGSMRVESRWNINGNG